MTGNDANRLIPNSAPIQCEFVPQTFTTDMEKYSNDHQMCRLLFCKTGIDLWVKFCTALFSSACHSNKKFPCRMKGIRHKTASSAPFMSSIQLRCEPWAGPLMALIIWWNRHIHATTTVLPGISKQGISSVRGLWTHYAFPRLHRNPRPKPSVQNAVG